MVKLLGLGLTQRKQSENVSLRGKKENKTLPCRGSEGLRDCALVTWPDTQQLIDEYVKILRGSQNTLSNSRI